jgi:hypothetical protein
LTDGAKDAYANVGGGGSLVEDIDEIGKETETPLTDGAKKQGGDAGADGSAEAVADGRRDDTVFEGDDNDLGQGKDRAMLTDGAKDADAYAGGDNSLVDDIDEIGKEMETTLTDGAKNQVGDVGANSRLMKDMDEIVDKRTGGDEGAKEGPVNNINEIGLILTLKALKNSMFERIWKLREVQ